jgi:hypothetical protein
MWLKVEQVTQLKALVDSQFEYHQQISQILDGLRGHLNSVYELFNN